jgi:hypothetical protein
MRVPSLLGRRGTMRGGTTVSDSPHAPAQSIAHNMDIGTRGKGGLLVVYFFVFFMRASMYVALLAALVPTGPL